MKINKILSPDSKNNVRKIESGLEKAFTLVELIVVITILAILGTIAFISLQGYSRDARDSTRTADIGNIKTSLELYSLKTGEYPKPDNSGIISYSGTTVWYQGIVGDQVTTNLKSLNEKPLDPLTNTPYTYSVTNSYKEYEVLALYEGSVAYQVPSPERVGLGRGLFPQANAATTTLTPKIDGTYNQVYVKTTKYIIPTPSIIMAEPLLVGTPLLLTSTNIKSLVITNGINIPKNTLTPTKTGALTSFNLAVFTGSITNTSPDAKKIEAITQIQQAYSGSSLSTQGNIAYILNQTSTGQQLELVKITLLKGHSSLTSNTSTNNTSTNNTPNPSTPSKKTVLNCLTGTGVLYGTLDGTDVGLTCGDDIIICNGTTGSGYTISACNVGATAVALSDNSNNTTSYGGLYQWGNNYDSRGGQFRTTQVYSPISTTQVTSILDYSTYSSTAYIQGYADWTSLDSNGLLRSSNWNVCPTGYHIPTQSEWNSVFTPALLGTTQTSFGITNQLKIPAAGNRYWGNAGLYYQGSDGFYWSSLPNGTNGYNMFFNSTIISPSYIYSRALGFSVRCFKN